MASDLEITVEQPFNLEVCSSEGDVDGIIPHWEKILKANKNARLFESHLWVLNYWEHRFHNKRNMSLIIGRSKDGEIIGILPVSKSINNFIRIFPMWQGVHSAGEYESNWICRPEYAGEFATAVLDYMKRYGQSWYQLSMDAVWEGSSALKAISSECFRRGVPFNSVPGREVPFISTSGEVSVIDDLLDGKYRREMRRRQKKLEEINSLTFELHGNRSGLNSALDEFFAVEASGWKGRGGSAIRENSSAERFWRKLSQDAAERKQLRLHLLRLGEDVISGQLGIVFGRTYYCLKIGYDEKFKQFGPGVLTTRDAIQHCIEDPNIDVYDFAGTAMPYMNNWTTRTYKTYTIQIGSSHLVLGGVFNLIQYGRRTLRPAWRTLQTRFNTMQRDCLQKGGN